MADADQNLPYLFWPIVTIGSSADPNVGGILRIRVGRSHLINLHGILSSRGTANSALLV